MIAIVLQAMAFVAPQASLTPLPMLHRPRCAALQAVAPSGIDALPILQQQAVFFGAFGILGLGSVGLTAACKAVIPADFGRPLTKAACLIGLLFMLAGYSHFALSEVTRTLRLVVCNGSLFLSSALLLDFRAEFCAQAFEAIYPPQGTWGLWYLPGSAKFHVAWTGVAEFLGGCGVLLGGAFDALGFGGAVGGRARPLRQLAALCLGLLMIAVWPSNLYMYTHGATMPGAGPDGPLPLDFHYVRICIQIVLLTVLGFLAQDEEDVQRAP